MKRAVSSMNEVPDEMKDAMHGIKMGVSSDICDNAKVNLIYVLCSEAQILLEIIFRVYYKICCHCFNIFCIVLLFRRLIQNLGRLQRPKNATSKVLDSYSSRLIPLSGPWANALLLAPTFSSISIFIYYKRKVLEKKIYISILWL